MTAARASLLRRAWGMARIAAKVPGQRRAPYLAEERLAELRDRRLRQIVRHAVATVPYYRRLFTDLGLKAEDIRTVADLGRLPLLDKGAVRERPEEFLSTSPGARRRVSFRTSGSTGVPLTVYHDAGSVLDNVAYGEREREVIRAALGGRARYRALSLQYRGSTGDEVRDFLRSQALMPRISIREKASPAGSFEAIVESMNRFRPDVLGGNGGNLEEFFRQVAVRGVDVVLPRLVVYHGQGMSGPGRELIESRLGVPIYSRYNAAEAFKIGFTCGAGTGFHLNVDLTHLCLVDPAGEPVPVGEAGEVVISNLVNRATVLLNYRLGDVGRLSAERCPCGRTLPLLTEVVGRVEEMLYLADGRPVSPRAIWSIFKMELEVLQYQIVQLSHEKYAVRLKTMTPEAFAAVRSRAAARLQELVGPAAQIEVTHHENLEGLEPGKFRTIVSRVRGS